MHGQTNNACLSSWEEWQALYDFFCVSEELVSFNTIKEMMTSKGFIWNYIKSEKYLRVGILKKHGNNPKDAMYSLENDIDPKFNPEIGDFELMRGYKIYSLLVNMAKAPTKKVEKVVRRPQTPMEKDAQIAKLEAEMALVITERDQLRKEVAKLEKELAKARLNDGAAADLKTIAKILKQYAE